MVHYERAEATCECPEGNDNDAILRWNTCARIPNAESNEILRPPSGEEVFEPALED